MNKKTKALLDSKVDLMEYFLGPDPKKTAYYKSTCLLYTSPSPRDS